MLPHWSGLTAIMTPIAFVIAAHTVIHHLHTSAHHYDFTVLTTHILPYLSLTLRDLSLDSHSFYYSSLSRLCSFLLSSLHFLCNPSIFIYGVLSSELFSVMATLVYIV